MSEESRPAGAGSTIWNGLRSVENGLVVAVLTALILLPLTEVLARKIPAFAVSGSSSFIQHLTLLVGVLGGALAARDGKLLSLSTLPNVLPPGGRAIAAIFSTAVAVAVSVVLCVAGREFVLAEPAGKSLAYGIPYRAFQWFLPVGFGLVALRLAWHSSNRWTGRLLTCLLAAGLVWLGVHPPVEPAQCIWPLMIGLLAATLLGAPLFTTLGGAAMILLWGTGRTASLIPLEHYYLVTDPILPSLPLFTIAGYFLAEGGASRRIVRVFNSVFGPFRGGPGIVTALVCAFFTSFTGASGVTILALGGLLMPVLIQARYSERSALGLITGAGSLGMLFPPCLPLILYAVIAQRTIQNLEMPDGSVPPDVSINTLFLGGLGPGLLMVALTAWWAIRCGPADKRERPSFHRREALAAVWDAKWELFLPLIALGAMLGGLATPVEAAAISAIYGFITQVIIHRDLKLTKDVPRVLTECGLLIGGVLLILGVAMGFTKFLILADLPTAGAEWIKGAIHAPWLFLLLLNLFLLVVGCLMDVYSAIVVVVPLIVPMGVAFGIDATHLGIIFLANLQLGFLTPPVGMNLFLSSYRFKKPMAEVIRATVPMMGVFLISVLLITYFPPLTTWLPRHFTKQRLQAPAVATAPSPEVTPVTNVTNVTNALRLQP